MQLVEHLEHRLHAASTVVDWGQFGLTAQVERPIQFADFVVGDSRTADYSLSVIQFWYQGRTFWKSYSTRESPRLVLTWVSVGPGISSDGQTRSESQRFRT